MCHLSRWSGWDVTVLYDLASEIEARAASRRRPRSANAVREGISVSAKGCIVIVEPDDLIRKLLERWLGEAGFEVVAVPTHHAIPQVVPQLVLTDISEPDGARTIIEGLRAAYAAPILATSARF